MSQQEELKACPFCNGERLQKWTSITLGDRKQLQCELCGASGPLENTFDNEEERWNQRPAENTLRAQLEQVTQKLDFVTSTGLRNAQALEASLRREAIYKAAVEHYGDTGNWVSGNEYQAPEYTGDAEDGTRRARQALKGAEAVR